MQCLQHFRKHGNVQCRGFPLSCQTWQTSCLRWEPWSRRQSAIQALECWQCLATCGTCAAPGCNTHWTPLGTAIISHTLLNKLLVWRKLGLERCWLQDLTKQRSPFHWTYHPTSTCLVSVCLDRLQQWCYGQCCLPVENQICGWKAKDPHAHAVSCTCDRRLSACDTTGATITELCPLSSFICLSELMQCTTLIVLTLCMRTIVQMWAALLCMQIEACFGSANCFTK